MSVETHPATQAAAVTPSDSTVINARALYVGSAGNLTVDMLGNAQSAGATDVAFLNVAAGTLLPISVRRVKAATTATNIVALY